MVSFPIADFQLPMPIVRTIEKSLRSVGLFRKDQSAIGNRQSAMT
jgi:hypothetical protein